jgi:hypothetical protein
MKHIEKFNEKFLTGYNAQPMEIGEAFEEVLSSIATLESSLEKSEFNPGVHDPKKGIEGAIDRVVGLSAQRGGNGTSGTTPKKQGPKQQSADTKLRTTARQVSKESSYNTRRREFIDKKRVILPAKYINRIFCAYFL